MPSSSTGDLEGDFRLLVDQVRASEGENRREIRRRGHRLG